MEIRAYNNLPSEFTFVSDVEKFGKRGRKREKPIALLMFVTLWMLYSRVEVVNRVVRVGERGRLVLVQRV